MKYRTREYAKKHGVTQRTVWNWYYQGKIKTERDSTGHLLIVEGEDSIINNNVAVYARVSSAENKDNLERQKQRLLDFCAAKGYTVVKTVCETGSGLNDKRPKLEKLLMDDSIKKIVVEHSDRFSRFGFNYIKKLMNLYGREIEVINEQSNDKDDLMQDFASIVTSFCARLYGLRRSHRKTKDIIEKIAQED